MKRELMQDWNLHYNELLFQILIGASVFILGVFVTLLIVVVSAREGEEPVTWATMGSMFALFAMAVVGLMVGVSSYAAEFRMHLCLGGTRRGFLMSFFSRQAAGMTVCYILAWIFWAGEQALYGALFPGAVCEISLLPVLEKWYFLPLLLVAALFGMFNGALRARFGGKATILFWFVWMFCCMVLPRMVHPDSDALLDRLAAATLELFLSVPGIIWGLVTVALSAAMATLTGYWGMRHAVT